MNPNSDVIELINPILQYIPEQLAGEDDLRLVFSVHDGPMAQSDWSIMDMSKQLAEAGLGQSQITSVCSCLFVSAFSLGGRDSRG